MAANPTSDILEIDLSAGRASSATSVPSATDRPIFPSPEVSSVSGSITNAPVGPVVVPTEPDRTAPAVDSPAEGKESSRPIVRDVLETAILTIAVFLLVRSAVQSYRISGTSMVPNFENDQFLVVNKLAYLLDNPQRGDVIVFDYPDGTQRDFIKRVIGVPGDTVEIRDGKVYINGLDVLEPYELVPFDYNAGPTLVGEDKLYVLGDNRADSEDSHLWGLLDKSHVVGKVWVSLWPLDTLGLIEHEPVSIQVLVAP